MRGWLVVNAFLQTQKFQDVYALLRKACVSHDIVLEVKTNADVAGCLQNDGALRGGLPSFVLFWDKDVYLARRLEALGARVFNSASAIETCDNKVETALALQRANLPMPQTYILPKTFTAIGYTSWDFLDVAARELQYPMVLKEAYGSFGAQVYLVDDRAAAQALIGAKAGQDMLLQRFIAASRGRDIRVNVVGDRAICAMERINERDFRSNIAGGGSGRKIVPSAAVEKLAVQATKAVGADFAGVDILSDERGEPLVCEVNSNPHFKSTLDYAGVDMSEYIIEYVRERV